MHSFSTESGIFVSSVWFSWGFSNDVFKDRYQPCIFPFF